MTSTIRKIHSADIIKRPRVTEKATIATDKNQYVFEVSGRASKISVAKAIKDIYGVTPIRVNITRNPGKTKFVRGKVGHTSGVKKAVVFLKKGDKIEIA